ncbi:secondary thiamine-phosphate synthase enzyme YjbQ [Patescibacteria group bacterium]
MLNDFHIKTNERYELVNITANVESIIKERGVDGGLVFVSVPHSTAAILLTEDEPNLKKDWLEFLRQMASGFNFLHNQIDDNGDSHLLSGILGQNRSLLIEKGKLEKGFWQEIFLAEFDGPKVRKIIVKIISEK